MKVAVSIPDPVFKAADRLAKELKKSRSELYAEAVKRYLGAHGHVAVREQLNAVYAVEDSRVDPAWAGAQRDVLGDETW